MNAKIYSGNRLIIVFIASLLLSSCSGSPEEKVKEYLEYTFMSAKGEKAYKLLAAEDRKFKKETEFTNEVKRKNVFNEKFLKKYREHFKYEILETKHITDDTIRIKVSLTRPRTSNILQEMVALAMATSTNKISEDQKKDLLEAHFGRLMKSDDLELESEEKEFTVIKENGAYKIFLNLSYPYKVEILQQKIENLELEAAEKIRKIDLEGAAKIFNEVKTLQPIEEATLRMHDIQEVINHSVVLGEEIKTGNLIIKPLKVEVRKVKFAKRNWSSHQSQIMVESEEPFCILTFEIQNQCEGEVIEVFENNRFKRNNVLHDNFGNEMKELLMDFDMINVEGYELKKISPGESRKMIAVCEAPLSPKASRFLWKMKVITDNMKTEENIFVSFSREQIMLKQ